jgi:hypothetical protein
VLSFGLTEARLFDVFKAGEERLAFHRWLGVRTVDPCSYPLSRLSDDSRTFLWRPGALIDRDEPRERLLRTTPAIPKLGPRTLFVLTMAVEAGERVHPFTKRGQRKCHILCQCQQQATG